MSWFGFGAQEEEDDPTRKKLVIELYGGRDVTDPRTKNRKEGPQFCDLFCTLRLGKQRFQTEVIKRAMNPIWQQSFSFDIQDVSDAAVIEVTCYHSGTVSNTFMGEVRIPIADHQDLSFSYAVQHWFPLYNPKLKKKDGSPGEIGMKIGAEGGPLTQATSGYDVDMDDRNAEEIYEEANAVASDANAIAHRALRMAEQTREIGSTTVLKLRDQGAQIGRMQSDMDTVNNNMRQSERKLRSIESVWGTMANTVTSTNNKRHKKKAQADRKMHKNRKKAEKKNRKIKEKQWEERKNSDRYNSKTRDHMIEAATPGKRKYEVGSQEEQFYATVDDTDKAVDAISCVLDDIKNIALDTGIELQEHNDRLDALAYDVNKAAPRMDSAIKRSRVILEG